MSPLDPRERDLVKCENMRIHAARAVEFLGSRPWPEFLADQMLQDAVTRCVEVIGEAARPVSDATRARTPEIPWPLVTGMRHILAHDYGSVDLRKVYDVVVDDLPHLLERLRVLIPELEKDVAWQDDEDA